MDVIDHIARDQNVYNPITSNVVNHIHFRFPDGSEIKRAFSYNWRLWSLAEIQDAMTDAGFTATTVYWEGTERDGNTGNGVFKPSMRGEACAGWIAYIVAEKQSVKAKMGKKTVKKIGSKKTAKKPVKKPVRA